MSSALPSESAPAVAIPVLRHTSLLRELDQLGLVLALEDGKLRLRGPGDKVTAELRQRVAAAKGELLEDLPRRQAFIFQLELDIDAATTWLELEMPLALAQEGYQRGTLSCIQTYLLGKRATRKARTIPASDQEKPARVRQEGGFMLTTQARLAARNGVPEQHLESIFRLRPGEVAVDLEAPGSPEPSGEEAAHARP